MKKHFKLWFFITMLLWAIFLFQNANAQNTEGNVSLEIKKWFLKISGSWTANIWTILSSSQIEEYIIPIENILQIKDVSGMCWWHYTTLQIDDIKKWSDTIRKENISINLNSKTTILGSDNPSISVWPTINNIRWLSKNPTTHLFRAIWTDCWYVWQYGTIWNIKINVPANQPTWIYRWKIYYLLIDNN